MCRAGTGSSGSAAPATGGTPLRVATLKIAAASNVPNFGVSRSIHLTVNGIAGASQRGLENPRAC